MPQKRRTKFVEEKNGPSGINPEYGAIFMSNSATRKECLGRGLLGLPLLHASFVEQVKAGMLLFLFEFESRQLHGVFRASSDGAMNIVPTAFCSSGKRFPAQVKFVEIWQCRPLHESEFRDAIKDNYFSAKKFNFGLSEVQVRRLLKLFSFKKLERSLLARTEVAKLTESPSSVFSGETGNHCSADGATLENDGDVDHKLDLRVNSPLDSFASRGNPFECSRLMVIPNLNHKPEIVGEFDMGARNDYSEDTSKDFRRVFDQSVLGIKDGIGNEYSRVSSCRTDALTVPFDHSLSDIRIPESLRHTPSDRSENDHLNHNGFAQVVPTRYPSSWSNFSPSAKQNEGLVEANILVHDPPRLPLEPLYTMNARNYGPSYLSLHGNAVIASTMPYSPDESNVDSLLSSGFAANRDSFLKEGFTSCGGYVNDNLSLEKVQPFPPVMEHNVANNHMDANVGQADYIPLPSNLHEYPSRGSMIAVTSGNVLTRPFRSEASRGRACHLPFPFENLSHSSSPSTTRPPCVFHLSSQDRVDLSLQDRVNNDFPAHQSKEELGGGASDFNNKLGWFQDHVGHAEYESRKTRSSVFARLGLPPKQCCTKSDACHVTDPVDEVMAALQDCQEDWKKQQKYRPNTSHFNVVSKLKTKKQKSNAIEFLEDNSMSSAKATLNDALACDESVQQTVAKPTFIDFRRRSETKKTRSSLTEGCKDSTEDPTPEKKRRKLVRPKLGKEELSKEKGTFNNPAENDMTSVSYDGENKVVTCEAPLKSSRDTGSKCCASLHGNTNGHSEQIAKHKETLKEKGTSNNPIKNVTTSYPITFAGENKVGTFEASVMLPMDIQSKSCPSQDGNSNWHSEEIPNHEGPNEDSLILCNCSKM